MKPKDLNYLYSWEERRPHFADRVLFVPDYYFEHDKFKMPSTQELFENENPISIEYCSGNGEWIIEKAINNPNQNWIAVEMRFKRVRKIWSKMMNLGLKNLIVVCGDANDFITFYQPDQFVDEAFVNFPDPWPKDKHAKNRLLQGAFIQQLKRTLKNGAPITVVTDDPDYSDQVINEMKGHLEPAFEAPHYIEKDDAYGSSYFNRLWVEMGRFIRFMKFQNAPES